MPKPKTRVYNRTMPREHPRAFQSPLWPHLEEIRALRRARKMWVEIAEHLERTHHVKVSYRAVRNFFVRTQNPKRRIPAGLEEHVGAKPAAPVPPAAAAPAPADPFDPVTENPADPFKQWKQKHQSR
jgi:hypothetical protein